MPEIGTCESRLFPWFHAWNQQGSFRKYEYPVLFQVMLQAAKTVNHSSKAMELRVKHKIRFFRIYLG